MLKDIYSKYKFDIILVVTILTSLLFIYATYAWLSASLNVTISEFTMKTNSENGLYISLDGITWSDSIEMSRSNMLELLSETYPNQKTQWTYGLFTVSSAGIRNSNNFNFDFYGFDHSYYRLSELYNKYDFKKIEEDEINIDSPFLAFDLFFKNVTPSPYSDNLYFDVGTEIKRAFDFSDNENDSSDDIDFERVLNSVRLGISFSDTTDINSSSKVIQNLQCNGKCHFVIYEPNSKDHTTSSIEYLNAHGVNIKDGTYYPTYALISGGKKIPIWDGIKNSQTTIDTSNFKLQNTLTSFNTPISKIPNSIIKARVYLWIEGQDVDILEKSSDEFHLSVTLNFRKDFASYE